MAADARQSRRRDRASWWVAAWLGWLGILTWLSSRTHPGPVIHVRHIDKVEHFTWFALGAVLLAGAMALRRSAGLPEAAARLPWRRVALPVVLVGTIVGGLDEWHQSFVPGRMGLDAGDWLADIAGSLAGAWLARPLLRRLS